MSAQTTQIAGFSLKMPEIREFLANLPNGRNRKWDGHSSRSTNACLVAHKAAPPTYNRTTRLVR